MTEIPSRFFEAGSDVSRQLWQASFDLRRAIRAKEAQTWTFQKQRTIRELENLGLLNGLKPSYRRVVIERHLAPVTEIRERLRQTSVIPLDASADRLGQWTRRYWGVYETPASAADGQDSFELEINEITVDSVSRKRDEILLYSVHTSPRGVLVCQDGAELADEQLHEPLHIIRAARNLYV